MFLLDICKMYIFKTTLKDLCADTYENKNNLYHIKLHKVSADYTNTKSKKKKIIKNSTDTYKHTYCKF